MPELNVVDLIVAKRDGRALEPDQIRTLVQSYTDGSIPDYQMSAFLMATYLQGMNDDETFALTDAMLRSGISVDLSGVRGIKVGKHSTGGVGDKLSMIIGPVVAAGGVPVPKVSGRGLGFTGGTLDKLESLPGFRTDLSIDQYTRQLGDIGLVLNGQTDEIAPADRALYALRDVTGTVEYIPLIASSIMSKKLAEGLDALVLDVKCGRGAFMKDEDGARELAETLVSIGERFGKRTVAWMTAMDVPLGRAVGNWPEMVEAIECLQGSEEPDLLEIVPTLAGEMLRLGGKVQTLEEGRALAEETLSSGKAFDKFLALVERQGGDLSLARAPRDREGVEPAGEVTVSRGGVVRTVDALAIGRTATAMGAGRTKKSEKVDPLAGLVLKRKPGERVQSGETLAHLYTTRRDRLDEFGSAITDAFEIVSDGPVQRKSVLLDRFAEGSWVLS